MNFTKLAIRRPVSSVLIIVALVVFGISSIFSFSQELTPEIEMPIFLVSTVYAGASPEDIEELITKKFEEEAGTLSGVDTIMSYSLENISMIMLQYDYGTDMDKAYNDLKKKLDGAVNDLPDSAGTPTIYEIDMNAGDTMTMTVGGDIDQSLLNYVNDFIVPELERLSNVASVSVSGGREDYIRIELKDELMKQYGVQMSTVVSYIGSADFSYPAGSTKMGGQSLSVTTGMDYSTTDSLKNIPITLSSGNIIHLSDVAEIYDAQKDKSSISRYNGTDVIAVGIQKQQSASAVDVSRSVTRTINQMMENNPGLEIAVIDDNSETIQDSISSVRDTLILGVVISMVILFLFFGDIKASLIVGSSIPLSLMVTFVLMNLMGFSLNVISMGSLVIGVGMMVDNSIVVLDSCFQKKSENGKKNYKQIAVEGAEVVTASIIGGTITTCVVFLPLAFMKGLSGQLFQQLGYTVVFSMVASLLSAITVVPLAFVFYKPVEKEKAPATRILKWITNTYTDILKAILPKKKTVMAISVFLLFFSFYLVTHIRAELMPNVDQGIIRISATFRPGTEIDKVEEVLLELEEMVREHDDVEDYLATSGSSGLSFSTGSSGSLMVYLKSDRKQTTDEITDQWKLDTAHILDCDISVSAYSMMSTMSSTGTASFGYESYDYDALKRAADEMVEALSRREDVLNASSSLENAAPLVKYEVDPIKAAAEGLTPIQIAGSLNSILSGKEATTIQQNGQEISVMVEYPADKYDTIEKLQSVTFTSPAGREVPLGDLGTIVFKDSPQVIVRNNGLYNVTITAEIMPGAAATAGDEILSWAREIPLPQDVSWVNSSLTEMQNDEFASLFNAIFIAVFLVFIVMAMQFESPKFSAMVMLCIPFSLIGSFGLLFLTDSTISMPSLLGFLMLIGTVVNNGILFVDTTNQYRETLPVEEALIKTGRTRLRPILMTTLTTALSMVPMAVNIGSGGEMMQGLAVVVIGGLLASMFLSLLMLPTFYLIMDGGKKKKRNQLPEEPVLD